MSQITIRVFHCSDTEGAWQLDEFIDLLKKARDKIPEEYRAEAKFSYEGENLLYDDSDRLDCELRVSYDREETDEEIKARQRKDEERNAEARARLEASEREQLRRLKDKYGE